MDAGTMEVIDQIVLRFSIERAGRQSAPPLPAVIDAAPSPGISLDQLWNRFCISKDGRIKPRTMERYLACFQGLRRCFPAVRDIAQVTDEIAEQYVTLRTAEVRPTTINSELRHLRGIWAVAVRKGLAAGNVFGPVENLKELPRTITVITLEEQARLIRAADAIREFPQDHKLKVKAIILIAVQGGLRSEELRHLRWCDINLETGEIRITCREGWTTKNGRNRTVFVLDDTLNILRALRGGNSIEQNAMPLYYPHRLGPGRDFKLVTRQAGVRCTLHDLRRTCASRMAESGVNLLVATALLGHSSPITTQKYYTKISSEALQRAVCQAQSRPERRVPDLSPLS